MSSPSARLLLSLVPWLLALKVSLSLPGKKTVTTHRDCRYSSDSERSCFSGSGEGMDGSPGGTGSIKVAVQRRSTCSLKWLYQYWLKLLYLEEHDWGKAVDIGK